MTNIAFTKWDLQHLSNTCTVYKVLKNANPKDIVAFLVYDAQLLADLRRRCIKEGSETLKRVQEDVSSKPINSAARSNEDDRLTWHAQQQEKYERQLRRYERLIVKLKALGLPKDLTWI